MTNIFITTADEKYKKYTKKGVQFYYFYKKIIDQLNQCSQKA